MEKRESMHTLGPWQHGRYGPESFEVQGEHRTLAIVRPVFSDAVTLANARLISAAPELLAACEVAVDAIDCLDYAVGRINSRADLREASVAAKSALEALASAIAKAEGREP